MKDPRFAKLVVFVNALVPLALLGWDAYRGQLGANPTEFALRTTGMLALVFLTLSLAVTPLRKLSGKNWLSHFRRMLGLYAFFYTALHLLIYLWRDQAWDLLNVPADTLRRPFILFGMLAFLLMVPLALTSTAAAVKRMGAKNWKRLHMLVYLAATSAVIHYFLRTKVVEPKPVAFILALVVLLAFRAAWALAAKRRRRPTTAPPATISPGEA